MPMHIRQPEENPQTALTGPESEDFAVPVRTVIFSFAATALLVSMLFFAPALVAQPAPEGDSDALVREVVALDTQINGLSDNIADLESRSRDLDDRILDINSEITAQRQRLERQQEALSDRVRSIYVNGKVSNLELLISSNDFGEFL